MPLAMLKRGLVSNVSCVHLTIMIAELARDLCFLCWHRIACMRTVLQFTGQAKQTLRVLSILGRAMPISVNPTDDVMCILGGAMPISVNPTDTVRPNRTERLSSLP